MKSMSKTEKVSKSASAAGALLGAIGKFGAKNDDGSPDALKILSGVADISNAIASFLPPPASVITGTVSSLLNIFGAGGPSTEEVVKEEQLICSKSRINLLKNNSKPKLKILRLP